MSTWVFAIARNRLIDSVRRLPAGAGSRRPVLGWGSPEPGAVAGASRRRACPRARIARRPRTTTARAAPRARGAVFRRSVDERARDQYRDPARYRQDTSAARIARAETIRRGGGRRTTPTHHPDPDDLRSYASGTAEEWRASSSRHRIYCAMPERSSRPKSGRGLTRWRRRRRPSAGASPWPVQGPSRRRTPIRPRSLDTPAPACLSRRLRRRGASWRPA
jgi:hypothetical protein